MPCSLPMHGGTGWVSHLNYEKERNLEIHHSDADSDSDGHRHHARRHLVHDVVVSPTTKENLPTLFYPGPGGFFIYLEHKDTKTLSFFFKQKSTQILQKNYCK